MEFDAVLAGYEKSTATFWAARDAVWWSVECAKEVVRELHARGLALPSRGTVVWLGWDNGTATRHPDHITCVGRTLEWLTPRLPRATSDDADVQRAIQNLDFQLENDWRYGKGERIRFTCQRAVLPHMRAFVDELSTRQRLPSPTELVMLVRGNDGVSGIIRWSYRQCVFVMNDNLVSRFEIEEFRGYWDDSKPIMSLGPLEAYTAAQMVDALESVWSERDARAVRRRERRALHKVPAGAA